MTSTTLDRRSKSAEAKAERMRAAKKAEATSAAIAYEHSLLRRVAWGVVCLKVAVIPLIFDPDSLYAFSQPKVLATHALDYVLLGLLAATALHHGRAMFRWSPLHVPVLAVTCAYVLAAAFAINGRVALYGTEDRELGLLAMLDALFLYFAVAFLARTRSDLVSLGAAICVALLGVVSYEFVQWRGADPFKWAAGALFSTLGNRGVLAQFLGTVAVGLAGTAVAPVGVSWRARTLAVALSLLAGAGALLSGGRAVLIGLTAGIVVVGVILLAWQQGRRRRVFAGAATLLLLFGVLVAALSTPTGRRVAQFLKDPGSFGRRGFITADRSLEGRLDLYRVALDEWEARPLLGVGPDNYAVAFPTYRTPASNKVHDFIVPQTSTHSWLAKIATDAGILGVLGFLACVIFGIVLSVRGGPSAWTLGASGAIVAFLGTGVVSVDHVATEWLPWLALGLIAAPISARVAGGGQVARGRKPAIGWRPGRWVLPGMVVALGLAAAPLAVADSFTAARYAQAARVHLETGTPEPSLGIAAAQRATALDPGRADYWAELGLGYFDGQEYSQAEKAYSRAAELAPFQAAYLVSLSKTELKLGFSGDHAKLVTALATARRAAATDANVPDVQYTLAVAAGAVGDHQQTVTAGEAYLRLGGNPDDTITEGTAGAYLLLDRPEDAERWLRLRLAANSGDRGLRILLARALIAEGRRAEALAQVQLVLATDPANKDAVLLRTELAP